MGLLLATGCGGGGDDAAKLRSAILLASPTTLQDSGLLDTLIPIFERESGYRVKPLAVGTGEALAMARRGDADVLLGHAPPLERAAVAEGSVRNRRLVMTNDFLLIGPVDDPAGVRGGLDVTAALAEIAAKGSRFVSRGDDSGTHHFELGRWRQLGTQPVGAAYVETGQGMGDTLQVANQLAAYTLVDRGTYLAFQDRISLRPLVVGDPLQLNVYSVMEVNPDRFPRVHAAGARALSDFLIGDHAQHLIGEFGRDRYGESLYHAAAGESEASITNPNS